LTGNLTIDQPGVRVVDMAPSQTPSPFRSLGRRLYDATDAVITDWTVRYLRHLLETDREKLLRFAVVGRKIYSQISRPALSLEQADAMTIRSPYGALPGPPTPSAWFAPIRGEPRGFVLYVHGGSFIAERSPRVTAVIGRFAAAANARVFAPTYRLAPEHPCPAAIEDIEAAFAWMRQTWPDEPLVAIGESAGAAILLSALQRMRDRGEAMPNGLMLLSPWLDLSLQSRSLALATFTGRGDRTMDSLALSARLYLHDRSTTDPMASPLFGDMTGLPPMLVHASRADALYDDAARLVDKVRDVGGDLTARLWSDEGHVWERTGSPAARQSIQLAAEFIRARLAS
jgi:monoterpene epsilon-lactone hydrolase